MRVSILVVLIVSIAFCDAAKRRRAAARAPANNQRAAATAASDWIEADANNIVNALGGQLSTLLSFSDGFF